MFFIPLSHAESVQLVINALRVAGGEADCTTCPANRVCMKQCLTIADAVERMLDEGSLPTAGEPVPSEPASGGGEDAEPSQETAEAEKGKRPAKGSHLKVIK